MSQSDKAPANIQRVGVTKRWSDAVIHQGTIYLVEVADDADADAASQFHQVFEQAGTRLAQLGSGVDRLLQVIVYLPHAEDLPAFNHAWDQWIPSGHAPSRACIHAPLASPHYRIELVITAACR